MIVTWRPLILASVCILSLFALACAAVYYQSMTLGIVAVVLFCVLYAG